MPKPTQERNRQLAEAEYHRGEAAPVSVPPSLQFGLSNICNLDCVFCCDHYPGGDAPIERYPAHSYEELLEILPKLESTAFHGVGEFFIDPRFEECMRLASEHGVMVMFNTNGTLLLERHRRALREHDANLHITISFDAATPETYRKLRGGDFAEVLRNSREMLEILRERDAAGRFYNGSTAAFVLMRENLHEAVDFLRLAHGMGFELVYFARLFDVGESAWVAERPDFRFDYGRAGPWTVPAEHDRVVRALRSEAARLGQKLEAPWPYAQAEHFAPAQEAAAEGNTRLCEKPWLGRSVVKTNGDLYPCCFMMTPVGNVHEAGFAGAWNSEHMQAIRRELAAGRFHRDCVTSNCPVYQRHGEAAPGA